MAIIRELAILDCGAGDPELITVKGFLALGGADAILYEECAMKMVRAHAGAGCDCIPINALFVGESTHTSRLQGMISSCAMRYRAIVWVGNLNGFLAGEGLAILDYASQLHVQPEVIPAVSSFQWATTESGIPLTWRGRNESFWIPNGRLVYADAVLAARSSATAVIPCDTCDMEETLRIFAAIRGLSEPAAVICQNSKHRGKRPVAGTLQSLRNLHSGYFRETSSFVVIGKVVEDHDFPATSLSLPPKQEFCRIEFES